jgi:phosphotransferase system enzyme I (PtsP)
MARKQKGKRMNKAQAVERLNDAIGAHGAWKLKLRVAMSTGASAAARQILIRLHEVMAARSNAQAKLNTVVEMIGEALSSEVCSIYLLREGVLELFATRGLKQEAVHVTRLAPGEGLVGTIAEECRYAEPGDEAAAHPDFSYRPETGEELFHSFAGVPIVRRERAVGVLCVQHLDPRRYDEVEIEALQTVAMVLSELIANADLVDEEPNGHPHPAPARRSPGAATGEGHGAGAGGVSPAAHHDRAHGGRGRRGGARPRLFSPSTRCASRSTVWRARPNSASAASIRRCSRPTRCSPMTKGWSRRINEAIDSGLTAEAAIERVQQRTRMRMRQIDDPLLQDRMHDLEDLSNRLLRIVSGQLGTAAQLGLRQDAILIARNLGPAELLEYDRRRLKGVVLEEGSLTAHVSSLRARWAFRCSAGCAACATSSTRATSSCWMPTENRLFISPSPDMDESFESKLCSSARSARRLCRAARVEPAMTKDGTGHGADGQCRAARRCGCARCLTGADGIGLFRTEFQFLVSATMPQRERQHRLYRDVLDAAGDKPGDLPHARYRRRQGAALSAS